MPLPRKAVLGILVDNLEIRGSVLPLSKKTFTRWAEGLNIPRGGETILYTGHLYQMLPAINAMASKMASFEDTWITKMMGLGRIANRFINISPFMARAKKEELKASNATLRSIALLLRNAGVEFGYLYEKELYSGVLVYDEGVDKVFIKHARKVQKLLAEHGVKNIITVDPHTTNVLRNVYPEVLDGFDVTVRNYLEVIAESKQEAALSLKGCVTVHDSCIYARSEEIIEQPRELLQATGLTVGSPELSGSMTHCCGGPIESLFPAQAHVIAEKRVGQLTETDCQVAVMCPICLVNLRGAAKEGAPKFRDIADILAGAFLNSSAASEIEKSNPPKE